MDGFLSGEWQVTSYRLQVWKIILYDIVAFFSDSISVLLRDGGLWEAPKIIGGA